MPKHSSKRFSGRVSRFRADYEHLVRSLQECCADAFDALKRVFGQPPPRTAGSVSLSECLAKHGRLTHFDSIRPTCDYCVREYLHFKLLVPLFFAAKKRFSDPLIQQKANAITLLSMVYGMLLQLRYQASDQLIEIHQIYATCLKAWKKFGEPFLDTNSTKAKPFVLENADSFYYRLVRKYSALSPDMHIHMITRNTDSDYSAFVESLINNLVSDLLAQAGRTARMYDGRDIEKEFESVLQIDNEYMEAARREFTCYKKRLLCKELGSDKEANGAKEAGIIDFLFAPLANADTSDDSLSERHVVWFLLSFYTCIEFPPSTLFLVPFVDVVPKTTKTGKSRAASQYVAESRIKQSGVSRVFAYHLWASRFMLASQANLRDPVLDHLMIDAHVQNAPGIRLAHKSSAKSSDTRSSGAKSSDTRSEMPVYCKLANTIL